MNVICVRGNRFITQMDYLNVNATPSGVVNMNPAYSITGWMRETALGPYFNPELGTSERHLANVEGWIPGVL
jgi:hypothetical protein